MRGSGEHYIDRIARDNESLFAACDPSSVPAILGVVDST